MLPVPVVTSPGNAELLILARNLALPLAAPELTRGLPLLGDHTRHRLRLAVGGHGEAHDRTTDPADHHGDEHRGCGGQPTAGDVGGGTFDCASAGGPSTSVVCSAGSGSQRDPLCRGSSDEVCMPAWSAVDLRFNYEEGVSRVRIRAETPRQQTAPEARLRT